MTWVDQSSPESASQWWHCIPQPPESDHISSQHCTFIYRFLESLSGESFIFPWWEQSSNQDQRRHLRTIPPNGFADWSLQMVPHKTTQTPAIWHGRVQERAMEVWKLTSWNKKRDSKKKMNLPFGYTSGTAEFVNGGVLHCSRLSGSDILFPAYWQHLLVTPSQLSLSLWHQRLIMHDLPASLFADGVVALVVTPKGAWVHVVLVNPDFCMLGKKVGFWLGPHSKKVKNTTLLTWITGSN